MIYFDNIIKLRFSSSELYKAHQQIDTFIQERRSIKLPYSWMLMPYMNSQDYSLAQIRSAFQIGLPGEREVILTLNKGDLISFNCNFCSEIRFSKQLGDITKRTARLGDEDEVTQRLHLIAERTGLSILSSDAGPATIFKIKKQKSPHFSLGQIDFTVVARVTDPALAEESIVNGLGKKRMFGFGFVKNLEVL